MKYLLTLFSLTWLCSCAHNQLSTNYKSITARSIATDSIVNENSSNLEELDALKGTVLVSNFNLKNNYIEDTANSGKILCSASSNSDSIYDLKERERYKVVDISYSSGTLSKFALIARIQIYYRGLNPEKYWLLGKYADLNLKLVEENNNDIEVSLDCIKVGNKKSKKIIKSYLNSLFSKN